MRTVEFPRCSHPRCTKHGFLGLDGEGRGNLYCVHHWAVLVETAECLFVHRCRRLGVSFTEGEQIQKRIDALLESRYARMGGESMTELLRGNHQEEIGVYE